MSHSLRSHEGVILIDNRNSPGIDDATMVAMGYPIGSGKGLYESSTYTCNHCSAVVVIEPKRTRERGFCRGCGQRICDGCNAILARTFTCVPMSKIIDETLERAVKQAAPTASNILLGTPFSGDK